MGWKALVRFDSGVSHHKQGIPCQDSGGYICFKRILIGAVSDGAGSAKFSDEGSQLAVEVSLKFLKKQIEELLEDNSYNIRRFYSEEEVKKLFSITLEKVIKELEKKSQERNCDLNDFACTLLLFVSFPDFSAAIQIGDGFIVVKLHGKEEYELLFKPDKGEFANQTSFITSTNPFQDMKFVYKSTYYPEFVCMSTDGLERLALNSSDWKPYSRFFQPLEYYLQNEDPNLDDPEEYVLKFLKSEKLNAQTDDDKTLLLCLFNHDFPEVDRSYIPKVTISPVSDPGEDIKISSPPSNYENNHPVGSKTPIPIITRRKRKNNHIPILNKLVFISFLLLLMITIFSLFSKILSPDSADKNSYILSTPLTIDRRTQNKKY
ncbi:PP2C family serine/threonine-protein phosphatase [Aphanizomenon flos-aquae]|uniref:PP2C family serine/threonine-protein phosphatase n=1 Tax=Aphanizomenon flos-aquae TaxID=1176 RepID=UPI000907BC40|nr:PP2C family serine/threonine-protein phosphatase [Aphanizomenon flos-aquae]